MLYAQDILENVLEKNPGESEFHQAVKEVLSSIIIYRSCIRGTCYGRNL
ncbi:MAG TPA: hypothetical protein VIH07_05950 [Candidatus Humimicrobiaceae bacterium]